MTALVESTGRVLVEKNNTSSMQPDESNDNNNNGDNTEDQELEIETSNKNSMNTNNTNKNSISTSNDTAIFSTELLQAYYKHLFPYTFLYNWLSYGTAANNRIFQNREFSFTIEPVPGEEIYIRYQSFNTQDELQNAIIKRCPKKIDIGGIYTTPPKDKSIVQNGKCIAEARELVFDIDMDDYDTVRNCGCTGSSICKVCWNFMKMAVKVMDTGLRNDFGYHHIAWFYSGRRGMHAWVCDESAKELTNEARSAITKYFQIELGSNKNKDLGELPNPLHPMLQRSFEILEPMFISNIIPANGHGLLATEENWMGLLNQLPDTASLVRDNLSKEWGNNNNNNSRSAASTPASKWNDLKRHLEVFIGQSKKSSAGGRNKAQKTLSNKELDRLENWKYEIVFKYTYPRLDMHVSMMRNHLLKSPFCVHPKSGRVCVPVQAQSIDEFDPFTVPTVPQLMDELDQDEKQQQQKLTTSNDDENDSNGTKRGNNATNIPNWQKTSLKQYYEPFQKEFLDPLLKQMRRNQRDLKDQEAAMMGDF